ncbi:MAG: CDP-glucose 4,6-dehydratase [Opitutales bacterium]|nr:CDP-glucose 4,6-dehydratase [Opitutales bacterium]
MKIDAFNSFYEGKRVLITGHTGFKGSWLSEWLLMLGANVAGFSLEPPTDPSLFDQLQLSDRVDHHIADIRDLIALKKCVESIEPDVVFHLAAQPLVRESYLEPVETYATNVMGSVNLMESLKTLTKKVVCVMVTTDKCYENREWLHGYRETDPLGGYDPYSSSKGCAELAISAYRRSFFSKTDSNVLISSARAGNVIGGGDWSKDRIVPDCMRSLAAGDSIKVRNHNSTRPWQHVLEPLSGYLELARQSWEFQGRVELNPYLGAFNFGPSIDSNLSVRELVEEILKHWDGSWMNHSTVDAVHEAGKLNLSIEKAFHLLKWRPVWSFASTVKFVVDWYRLVNESDDGEAIGLTQKQILKYMQDSKI